MRVLFTSAPMLGHFHPLVPFAHALADTGHDVAFAAHRLLGELDTAEGHYVEAAARLARALALADACEAPYERALTLRALAELRAVLGATGDARALLSEARVSFTPLGAKPTSAFPRYGRSPQVSTRGVPQ